MLVVFPPELQDLSRSLPLRDLWPVISINIFRKPRELVASTSAPLPASGSWASPVIDMSNHGKIYVTVFSDQAGTLYIDQSPDGVNWDASESISVSAGVGQAIVREIAGSYVRIRYVNGATAQTVFRLYVWRSAQ